MALQAAGIQQGVVGAVHDSLRADVHPASGRHLAIAGHPHLGGHLPVILIVIQPHQKAIGNNDPRVVRLGPEQPQRMTGSHYQSLVLSEIFQVFFDQPVLHPVLANASGLSVGHQFIWVERHIKIQVIINHDLKCLAGQATAIVGIHGPGLDGAGRTEAVAVNPSPGHQFIQKLRSQNPVMGFRDIPKRIFQSRPGLFPCQTETAIRRPPDALHKIRHFRQRRVQPDCHGIEDIVIADHNYPLSHSGRLSCIYNTGRI